MSAELPHGVLTGATAQPQKEAVANTRPTSNKINVSANSKYAGRVKGIIARLQAVSDYVAGMSSEDLKQIYRSRGDEKSSVLVEHELNDRILFVDHMTAKLESMFSVSVTDTEH